MSKTVKIDSKAQFDALLQGSRIVVADFYADWCQPCKAIAPIYEQLSQSLSRPQAVTFTKVDTEANRNIAATYSVSALPTFILFRNGQVLQKVTGADAPKLQEMAQTIASEATTTTGGSSSSGGANWLGAELPRGYSNVSDQVEIRSSEILNLDADYGNVRSIFETSKPGAMGSGKQKDKDWVLSDMDEQLLLFIPFQSMLKLHTLQITSVKDEDEDVVRPAKIKLFTNRSHNLGFDEAESEAPTQTVELKDSDWNDESTAGIPLRFVKFQNINSLVIFVESGAEGGEKTRLDRLRLIGEAGEKREMGKLQKPEDS